MAADDGHIDIVRRMSPEAVNLQKVASAMGQGLEYDIDAADYLGLKDDRADAC